MKIALALFSLCLLAGCEFDDHPYYSHRRTVYVRERPYYGYRETVYVHDRPSYYGRGRYYSRPVYRSNRTVYRRGYYSTAPRTRVIVGY